MIQTGIEKINSTLDGGIVKINYAIKNGLKEINSRVENNIDKSPSPSPSAALLGDFRGTRPPVKNQSTESQNLGGVNSKTKVGD